MGRCIYTGEIKALGFMVTHCTYSESSYFSLFENICLVKYYRKCELNSDFFTFIF